MNTVPVSQMPYWQAGMWLLDNCHTDPATIANMRDMVPSIRKSGMYSPAEIDQAVSRFETRVQGLTQ